MGTYLDGDEDVDSFSGAPVWVSHVLGQGAIIMVYHGPVISWSLQRGTKSGYDLSFAGLKGSEFYGVCY